MVSALNGSNVTFVESSIVRITFLAFHRCDTSFWFSCRPFQRKVRADVTHFPPFLISSLLWSLAAEKSCS